MRGIGGWMAAAAAGLATTAAAQTGAGAVVSVPPPGAALSATAVQSLQTMRTQLSPELRARIAALPPPERDKLDRNQLRLTAQGARVVLAPTTVSARPIEQLAGSRDDEATYAALRAATPDAKAKLEALRVCQAKMDAAPPPPPPKWTPAPKASLPQCNVNAFAFNWHDAGYTTRAKDQGACGGCWAFATTGAMESALLRNSVDLVASQRAIAPDAAEQDLISCSGAGSCDGGFGSKAVLWIKANGQGAEWQNPFKDISTKSGAMQ